MLKLLKNPKKLAKKTAKKFLLFCLCLIPATWLLYRLLNNQLGAEPVAALLSETGLWCLRFLLITLTITPVKRYFRFNFIAYRRMLGLYAFFYALLHFAVYVVFEQGLDFQAILDDILKRNFILLGMLSFLLLIPLAVTSTKGMMRRLGKHWKTLHKSTYWLTALGLLHFIWIQKSDYTEPLIYVGLFAVLMGFRRRFGGAFR